ncbi:putative transcription factor WD40-like family [Helianthus anomalus]
MEVEKNEMSGDVACLDIAPIPEGRQRSRFLAVGSYDNTIRILSLDLEDCIQVLSLQSVSSPPESLMFLEVQASSCGEDGADHPASLFLKGVFKVGFCLGPLWTWSRASFRMHGLGFSDSVLLSCHFLLTPLSYETLEYAASFSSDQCAEGVVAVAGDTLRVFTIEGLGETFNETAIPLRFTPRKFVFHPKKKLLVTIESDQGAFPAELRESAKKECFEAAGQGENVKMEIENGGDDEDKDDPVRYPLAVGTAKDLQFWPKRSLTAGYIHIYRFVKDGKSLELLHKTQVDGVPLALCQFQGRLLAGIGSILRLYDLGKRRLLRKCENKLFPNTINSIHTYRDRIYVGDIQESFHYCKYRCDENQLYVFADDSVPRCLTSAYHVDFDTMAGADQWRIQPYENIYFVRLPQDVLDEIEDDPTGGKIKWEQGKLNGAPNKVEEIVQFHVGDVVTWALLAFTSRDDVDFFSHLEMHMQQEHPPLCVRDHMAYRSAYFPVKVITLTRNCL